MNKFWNVKANGGKASLDLFGYVGGSKDDPWGKGFNESEFLADFRKIPSDSPLARILNETFRKPRSIVQTIKPPKSAEEFGGFR